MLIRNYGFIHISKAKILKVDFDNIVYIEKLGIKKTAIYFDNEKWLICRVPSISFCTKLPIHFEKVSNALIVNMYHVNFVDLTLNTIQINNRNTIYLNNQYKVNIEKYFLQIDESQSNRRFFKYYDEYHSMSGR